MTPPPPPPPFLLGLKDLLPLPLPHHLHPTLVVQSTRRATLRLLPHHLLDSPTDDLFLFPSPSALPLYVDAHHSQTVDLPPCAPPSSRLSASAVHHDEIVPLSSNPHQLVRDRSNHLQDDSSNNIVLLENNPHNSSFSTSSPSTGSARDTRRCYHDDTDNMHVILGNSLLLDSTTVGVSECCDGSMPIETLSSCTDYACSQLSMSDENSLNVTWFRRSDDLALSGTVEEQCNPEGECSEQEKQELPSAYPDNVEMSGDYAPENAPFTLSATEEEQCNPEGECSEQEKQELPSAYPDNVEMSGDYAPENAPFALSATEEEQCNPEGECSEQEKQELPTERSGDSQEEEEIVENYDKENKTTKVIEENVTRQEKLAARNETEEDYKTNETGDCLVGTSLSQMRVHDCTEVGISEPMEPDHGVDGSHVGYFSQSQFTGSKQADINDDLRFQDKKDSLPLHSMGSFGNDSKVQDWNSISIDHLEECLDTCLQSLCPLPLSFLVDISTDLVAFHSASNPKSSISETKTASSAEKSFSQEVNSTSVASHRTSSASSSSHELKFSAVGGISSKRTHERRNEERLKQYAQLFMLRRHIVRQQQMAQQAPPYPVNHSSEVSDGRIEDVYPSSGATMEHRRHHHQLSSDVVIDIEELQQYVNDVRISQAGTCIKAPSETPGWLISNAGIVMVIIVAMVAYTRILCDRTLGGVTRRKGAK